jgi:hypothetical protein
MKDFLSLRFHGRPVTEGRPWIDPISLRGESVEHVFEFREQNYENFNSVLSG